MNRRAVYLDHAAGTPVDKRVLAAMEPYFVDRFYNPSAIYLPAVNVKQEIAAARATVANWLGTKPSEIIFTAGGTEANNLAIFGLAKKYPRAEIITTAIEHDSILEPINQLKQYGVGTKVVKPDKAGLLSPESITKKITSRTILVSVIYANNEIGTVQPLRQIAHALQSEREKRAKNGNQLPLYFHTDACQAGNYLPLKVHNLGVDLMTLNGSKIYGPKQSGVLFVRTGVEIEPLLFGGGQERGLRSGTENVPAIIGFAKALDMAQTQREAETARLRSLQSYFIDQLQQKLSSAPTINGSLGARLPNNLHLTFARQDNERLMMQLDELGIQVGLGSACSASSEEPSHVLSAIGLSEKEARASLRLTMGRSTTKTDIDYVIDSLVTTTS